MCCTLLHHNPHWVHQHYKRHVCGPFCGCKHWFFWISPIFEHQFCLNYMGTVRHWQPFWSTKRVRFTGQCWYFSPQWTAEQAIVKARSVRTVLVSWEKWAVTNCLLMYRCLWRGLWGGGGTFWLLNESLTFKGPEVWQATAINRKGVRKIPPNFDKPFATSLEVVSALKGIVEKIYCTYLSFITKK